ncbi:response regulator [Paenibacillus cisolokensis]|uniref:response regulator transcription factor n=1 Tax=Paenibacillus cisolokensis TaxID=1658519 RepID=UPI003D2A67D6
MLKAVVFDDEYIVLEGLRSMIDWQRYGIELAGTAGDGLTALQMLRDEAPDIVLTDIRMPGMDGLQLIETAAKELPDTMFLIFSGFNEFEYVKRAIGLGVVDYLDKPITVSKIEDALLKAIERIAKQQEFSALKVKWEASRAQLLEKATLDLLLTGAKAVDQWKEAFGPDAARVVGLTVLAFAEAHPGVPEHPTYRIVDVTNGEERLSVAFHYALPPEFLWERLIEMSNQASSAFGTGKLYLSLSEAPNSYREALRALRYGRFLEENGWTRIEDVEGNEPLPADLSKHEEAVIVSLRTGDREGLSKALDGFEAWVEAQKPDPDQVEQEILKLVYLGRKIAEESGKNLRKLEAVGHGQLSAMHSREDMFRWLRKRLDGLLSLTPEPRPAAKHPAIEKALSYLEERYGQDVSLQELAEHVGLNPTYFSLLFKEEVGITYIKHLTRIRMEKAKTMLREGMRVGEVSEKVGYLNYRHFTEIFKKSVGVTPGQYRESFHPACKGGVS